MPSVSSHRRPLAAFLAATWCAITVLPPLVAQTQPPAPAPVAPSAMTALINRLVERGVLSKQDGNELIAQAEADAADARVQAAETILAAAKADAAVARAQAALAQARQLADAQQAAARALLGQAPVAPAASGQAYAPPVSSAPVPIAPPAAASNEAPAVASAAVAIPPPAETLPVPAQNSSPAAVGQSSNTAAAPTAVASSQGPGGVPTTEVPNAGTGDNVPTTVVPMDASGTPQTVPPSAVPAAQTPTVQSAPAYPAPVSAPAPAPAANAPMPDTAGAPAQAADVPAADQTDGTVRVAYVPQVVKDELREEVRADVLAEERKEHWAGVEKVPDWVSRITLFGDVRVREEEIINHATNDTTYGSFPNFNAINTSTPIDLAAVQAGTTALPQYDVDQNRNRTRFRARVGVAADLQNGFTAGVRFASGNDDNPVTENQTMGAAGAVGQGGDFSKYAAWIDRAFIKYQSGGDPTRDISVYLGRFDNPFYAPTTLVWANEMGFDGAALVIPGKVHLSGQVVDTIKPFLIVGAFPVFDTDLNFATENSAKYQSYDKWLEAAQAGFEWRISDDFTFKTAGALYEFKNIEGQLSTPFTPLLSSDAGNTDASRPAFAQNGNTYMELRDIVPGPQNGNGTTLQWQYFGLATPFHELDFSGRLAYDHFDPFQISLTSEFVENLAFNQQLVAAKAINNFAVTSTGTNGAFAGGNKGWVSNLKFGNAVLQKGGNWNLALGYRYLQTDSVVDGFTDADFGGSLLGTNLKGFTLDANLALAPGVSLEARWMSATAIMGPTFKDDLLQFDINGKF